MDALLSRGNFKNNNTKKIEIMYYTIELYLEKGDADYTGEIQTEDRYIIVDAEGFDACGEHMTFEEAKKLINELP